MFDKVSGRLQKASQPLTNLMAINARALQELSAYQTEMVTGILDDSVSYVENLTAQNNIKGILTLNMAYARALRSRTATASKEVYELVGSTRREAGSVVKTTIKPLAKRVERETEAVQSDAKRGRKSAASTPNKAKAQPKKTSGQARAKKAAEPAPQSASSAESASETSN